MIEGIIIVLELFFVFLLIVKINSKKGEDINDDLGLFSYKDKI